MRDQYLKINAKLSSNILDTKNPYFIFLPCQLAKSQGE